jgi:hypothetical protein
MSSCRDDEQRVVQVAVGRPPGSFGHRSGIRIDADYEHVGLRRRGSEDGAPVARAEVERDAGIAARQASDVAGVELAEAPTSNYAQHAVSLRRGSSRRIAQPGRW